MEITLTTDSYNQRRYGKPWIAKVDFSDPKGAFSFGDWIGDGWNGGAGTLQIDANPGDIIATGQKDNRNPKYSAPDFYEVTSDGKLNYLGDKGAAYKHYKDQPTIDRTALTAERDRLMARVAEINTILGE